MSKLIIPCVYLKCGRLVKGFADHNIISDDPVSFCVSMSVGGADAIILFDLSDGDDEHELSLLTIRKINEAIDTPVYGAGGVVRLEDVKKLLYAGCKKVALNMAKQSNIDLIEEAGKRFSKNRILVCADTLEQILDNQNVINKNTSGSILLDRLTFDKLDETNVIAVINEDVEIKDVLQKKCVSAVSGEIVNRCNDLFALKDELALKGLDMNIRSFGLSWDEMKCNTDGLVPVVCQDNATNEVLMVAYMNKEAFEKTVREGVMNYYSRSRKSLWKKGETSGHYQYVKSLYCDCDNDTLLAKVVQIGNACHTGSHSCFFKEIFDSNEKSSSPYAVLEDVMAVINDRKVNPKEGSYTNYLFDKGIDKILKKIGEEATETVIAAKNPENEESKYEIADLLYHLMVLMSLKGITWDDVMEELANR